MQDRSSPRIRLPVVYTMGKVGSSSLSKSIQAAGLPCYDIHTLDKTWLLNWSSKRIASGAFPEPHVCLSMAYRERLFLRPAKCAYITSVREPVARNISAFFQNYHYDTPNMLKTSDAADAFKLFMSDYSHNKPIRWFDNEFKRYLHIDVLDRAFDREQRFYRDKDRLVIFRLDTDPEIMNRELSAALGAPVRITRKNDSSKKIYADLYRQVREMAKFSPAYLDSLYDTAFARHFWTEDELQAYRAYWLGESDAGSPGEVAG